MATVSTIVRARAALEGSEQGREHGRRWCRWVSSAMSEASPLPSSKARAGGEEDFSRATTSIKSAGVSTHGGDVTGPGRASFSTLVCGVDELLAGILRVKSLQETLESRLIATLPAPRPPPPCAVVADSSSSNSGDKAAMGGRARVVVDGPRGAGPLLGKAREDEKEEEEKELTSYGSGLMKVRGEEDKGELTSYGGVLRRVGEEVDEELTSYGSVLRKVGEEVDARLGSRAFTSALEKKHASSGTDVRPSRSTLLPDGCEARRVLLNIEAAGDRPYRPTPSHEGASRGELERERKMHGERLAGLLSACLGAMPLEPRGGGWG